MKNMTHIYFVSFFLLVLIVFSSVSTVGCQKDEIYPSVDISEYTESENYHVENVFETKYGTVLYFWPVGTPHGGISPNLALIKEDGNKISLSEIVPREDLWHNPEFENLALSEDGKTITFSVSFEERSEYNMTGSETVVLHEAGTYYFVADLEKGETKLIEFQPAER